MLIDLESDIICWMKIISLNCWGGHEFNSIVDFINEHKDSTDIFCLQEVFSTSSPHTNYKDGRLNFLEEMKVLLPGFAYIYTPAIKNYYFEKEKVDYDLGFGNAIFYLEKLMVDGTSVKKVLDWTITNEHGDDIVLDTLLQTIDFVIDGKQLAVANFHGMPFPGSKLDTADRLLQSETILNVYKQKTGEFMVLGDFNLLPETKSIGMLEENGLRSMISEFGIETTRSELNGWRGKEDEQKFADYVFVTKGIHVKNFEVPDINISDHLPMIMEFEL